MVTYNIKLVLLGDGRTGKTSIRKRYMGEGFTYSHLVTLGASFASLNIKTGEDTVALQIWDIGGQPTFETIRKRFISGANAMMMVYDITNEKSFLNLNHWLKELWTINNNNVIPMIIIGNKLDLDENRAVSKNQLNAYIKMLKQKFPSIKYINSIETSALTEKNIKEAFDMLITDITHYIKDESQK